MSPSSHPEPDATEQTDVPYSPTAARGLRVARILVTVAAALVVAEFVIRVIVELATNQVLAWSGGFIDGQRRVLEHEAGGAAAFSHRELVWFR